MNDSDDRSLSASRTESEFERLLKDAQAGSQAAMNALIEKYRPYLLRIANDEWDSDLNRKLGASDLVQESLISAQQALDSFEGNCDESLLVWLRGILLNRILEAQRRFKKTAKRDAKREVSLAGGEQSAEIDLSDHFNTPSSEAVANEEEAALYAAIERLPQDYREVLSLRNWRMLSFEEIGSQLNRSREAARKLWSAHG